MSDAEGMLERTVPHSREAERCVLGSMLRSNDAINVVVTIVNADSFYFDAHRKIFQGMTTLNTDAVPVDLVTLAEWLLEQKFLEDVGGYSYLGELWDAAPTAANAEYYARIVRDKAVIRNLIAAGTEILRDAYDQAMPADDLLEGAERKILDVAEKGVTGQTSTLQQAIHEAFDRIDARSQKDYSEAGIPTGYIDLDELTAGLHKNELIILAARPSVGKCLAAESEIVLTDGSVATIAEVYRRQRATLLTLGDDWRLRWTEPSRFVDDGLKPVYRVTTGLGRQIEVTLSHPFRTLGGWKPLAELKPGDAIAVPRRIDVLGDGVAEALCLEGCVSDDGQIPPQAFRLSKSLLARFLDSVLFDLGDCVEFADVTRIEFAVPNQRLARQLQHLLLRFGIIAALHVSPRECRLCVDDPESSQAYFDQIGALKVKAVDPAGADTPVFARTAGHDCGRSSVGDVYWDRVVAIEYVGVKQVYDLTVPGTHNFVANDVCVHNTAFALNLVRNIVIGDAVRGVPPIPVFFVSLEQSKIEIADRLLCMQSRVDSHRMRKANFGAGDMDRLIAAGDILNKAPLYIDDSPSQGMLRIAANARRLKKRNGIRMVVIDYLQLIEAENRRDSRQEQVAQISRRLKFLARELQIPVMALAQVNRSSEDRQDHKPRLADLRESGSLEQDADTVFLLHRPGKYDGGQEDKTIEVLVAKQRNGPTGDITLTWEKQIMRFENYALGGPGGFD